MITLYSTHCPKCNMLEGLMKKKGMEFDLVDDEKEVLKIADENGIVSAPFAKIDNQIYNTKDLQDYIKSF